MSIRKTMTVALGVLLLFGAALAEAAEWKADPAHSVLTFKVRHLFSKTAGQFDEWSATLDFDPQKIEEGSVGVTIQSASINTQNEQRDGHLRSPDFFDVETYPTISFASSRIEKTEDGYLLHGTLDMRGVQKEIAIAFEFMGSGKDPWGNVRAGFAGQLVLDRKDFGIEWNKALDQGGLILGDEVEIEIEIEAVQAGA
jgi:polyisoprenoid-binding protein YceI